MVYMFDSFSRGVRPAFTDRKLIILMAQTMSPAGYLPRLEIIGHPPPQYRLPLEEQQPPQVLDPLL